MLGGLVLSFNLWILGVPYINTDLESVGYICSKVFLVKFFFSFIDLKNLWSLPPLITAGSVYNFFNFERFFIISNIF